MFSLGLLKIEFVRGCILNDLPYPRGLGCTWNQGVRGFLLFESVVELEYEFFK